MRIGTCEGWSVITHINTETSKLKKNMLDLNGLKGEIYISHKALVYIEILDISVIYYLGPSTGTRRWENWIYCY